MRNFRNLRIWESGISLCEKVYAVTEGFPASEKYGLTAQMRRAAISIPSNIAEGCRGGDKEMRLFLRVALGSAFELETQLILARRMRLLNEPIFQELITEIQELQKGINALQVKIKD